MILPPPSGPIWIDIAAKEIGIAEIKGKTHAQRILDYHKTTTLKATEDEVPWCSSFVNWVMKQAGYEGTNSASSRSWMYWGAGLSGSAPAYGSIVLLSRGNNPALGHVGFYCGRKGSDIVVLAGNQGDKVSVSKFPSKNVITYRWP